MIGLIRFRNQHGAFAGEFGLPPCSSEQLVMEWKTATEFARLEVRLPELQAELVFSTPAGIERRSLWPAGTGAGIS